MDTNLTVGTKLIWKTEAARTVIEEIVSAGNKDGEHVLYKLEGFGKLFTADEIYARFDFEI